MSKIKEKVDAELKTVKSLCETMENAIKTHVDRGLDKVDTHELYEAVDIYKDLSEVKKNVVKTCYYMQIMDAMEESEYGEDYDEDGPVERKFYDRYRYSNGRFAPKGRGTRRNYTMTPEIYRSFPEDYRDMDIDEGRMYYTEPERDVREGASGMLRKTYIESKAMHKGKAENMKELEKYLQELSKDVSEMLVDASPEEKTLARNKMQVIMQKLA